MLCNQHFQLKNVDDEKHLKSSIIKSPKINLFEMSTIPKSPNKQFEMPTTRNNPKVRVIRDIDHSKKEMLRIQCWLTSGHQIHHYFKDFSMTENQIIARPLFLKFRPALFSKWRRHQFFFPSRLRLSLIHLAYKFSRFVAFPILVLLANIILCRAREMVVSI